MCECVCVNPKWVLKNSSAVCLLLYSATALTSISVPYLYCPLHLFIENRFAAALSLIHTHTTARVFVKYEIISLMNF